MTETKSNNTESDYLFENNFAYVTDEGEVYLKKNKFFDKRVLAKVDPDTVEQQIEKLQESFSSVREKFESLFEETDAQTEEQLNELKEKLEALKKDAAEAEAIGDFEKMISEAEQKFSDLKESVQKAVEEEETESVEKEEVSEAAEDELNEESPEEATVEAETETEESAEEEPEEDAAAEDETEEEENKTEEAKEEPVSESQEEDVKSEEAVEEEESEEEQTTENYYKELAEKAKTLSEMSDWAYASMEFDNIDTQWGEGPDPEEVDIKPYRKKIDELREQFEEKKKTHYEEQRRIRQQNLEKKKELLQQLKEIVDEEKWTHTREVGKIKGKWDSIKPIPADEQEKLEKAYNGYISTFDEHKVDRLVKKKQQEEDNLTGKLVILEKMEKFLKTVDEKSDWKELDKKFADFTKQFRRIGRVPAEKNQDIWDRFHEAQDTFHSMRFKYDKKYRKDIEKFLSKKKKLIDEAEALVDTDNIAKAARQVNKLHRQWKKVGNLPQKDENELWDRFKAATDAFNDKKSDNIEVLRKQEDQNYQQKLKLIEKAEEIQDSEDWENIHNEYQKLMDQWKKIGPVPRKKSSKIWKKFKGAMDHFYDRRRDFFKEVKEERKDNLKEKEDILDQLKALTTHDNPIEAVNQAKPLQEEFKKAGYVPIKHKNRMWKEYRETCDVIYDRFRAAKSAAQVVGKENIDNFSTDDIADIRNKQKEADKLRKQINKLSNELIQMKESLSYFKPSSSGSSLLDDVKERIDKAESDIADKEDKLQDLEIEIDKIKRGAE
ncbi:DUF349 domain-containing protein [Rhodohalobacter sp. 614A]|uniref:DUF349 domain-containing protein n=1 Tax=Rhodohalobacter sp. 614A TaxID=2908649 RepID=UPI001F1AE5A9|nr:DUF349 domain-containing protein [Rhodohalobacter sp. 614A]